MGQRTSKHPPKTLVNLAPVQVLAATFVDGQSMSDTRFVAVVGDNIHFLHPEGVDDKIKQPAGWLKDAIRNQLKHVHETEIPESEVTDLPEEAIG